MAYLFCSDQFQEQKKRYITGTKVLRVSGESMARIELPFPPLEIQREVVRVLDSFAELEAELEAEPGGSQGAVCVLSPEVTWSRW